MATTTTPPDAPGGADPAAEQTTELPPAGSGEPGTGDEHTPQARLTPRGRRAVIAGAVVAVLIVLRFALDIPVLAVLVTGVDSGAVYALVGLGLVLVYKATKVLNFAQGELGTVPALLVFTLLTGFNLELFDPGDPSVWTLLGASVVAVAAGALLGVAIYLIVVEKLADASEITAFVATVGVALFLIGAELIIFRAQVRQFPRFIDGSPCLASDASGACVSFLNIAGARISWNDLLVLAVLAVAAAVLAAFFRTPVGVALLATAQEPYAARLQGVSTRSMSILAWGAAGILGAVAGILGGGVFEIVTPGLITADFLIPAFVAVVLGGLTSMVGAVVGGLLLGISVSFANTLWLELGLTQILPGPPQIITFAVLLAVLLVRPQGLLGERA